MEILQVGAAWGLGWTRVSAHSGDRFQSIIDESEWQKVSGKSQCRAVSACHVTLIDTALAVAQPPVHPGLSFQFAPWFIYRDTGLNNHWGGSGLFVVSVLPCSLKGMAGFNLEYQEKESSCCKRCSVHVRTHFDHRLFKLNRLYWIIVTVVLLSAMMMTW